MKIKKIIKYISKKKKKKESQTNDLFLKKLRKIRLTIDCTYAKEKGIVNTITFFYYYY